MPVVEAEPRRIVATGGSAQDRDQTGWIVFAALMAALCAWIVSLPVLPSQDGGVHVYYARISRDLLLGHPGFEHDYRIVHYLPPYSVHAYLLMLLLQSGSPLLAEKLIACVCVIVVGGGLVYLAQQAGRSAPVVAALSAPFLLHRWIFMGFFGYVIVIGFALLAAGIWIHPGKQTTRRRATFLAITALTLLSHPVPYLVVVAFCWIAVLAGWWNTRIASTQDDAVAAPAAGDLLTLALATAMLLYVKVYSHAGPLWDNELLADLHDKLFRIINVFRTTDVLPLRVPIYNWVLGALLVAIAIAACWRARRDSQSGAITRATLVLAWAFVVVIALPFLPRMVNANGFFAERFSIWPPLLFFASAASFGWSQRARRALLATAVLLTGLTIAMLAEHIGPIARQMDISKAPRGELKGVHLLWRSESPAARDLTFDPYIVASVRLVDREDAILSESPWMDSPILLIEETNRAGTSPGMAITRCGASRGESTAERLVKRQPEQWRLLHYACFQVLTPAR